MRAIVTVIAALLVLAPAPALAQQRPRPDDNLTYRLLEFTVRQTGSKWRVAFTPLPSGSQHSHRAVVMPLMGSDTVDVYDFSPNCAEGTTLGHRRERHKADYTLGHYESDPFGYDEGQALLSSLACRPLGDMLEVTGIHSAITHLFDDFYWF